MADLAQLLAGASDALARRAVWTGQGLESPAASFLAELEPGPWVPEAWSALARPRVGNVARAARSLTAALGRAPELDRSAGAITALVDLAGASEWAAKVLAVQPELALALARCPATAEGRAPQPRSRDYLALVTASVEEAGDDTERFEALLRDLRTQENLRIGLRELRGANLRDTSAELASLASAALQGALDHHVPQLVARHGPLDPPCRHLVVGLGKLGGGELNLSSDIDLLYVYETDEARAGELSSHQFHVKLFERVTHSLSRLTDRGRVFRVDIDLRPEGRTGPLCNSLAGLERYYETWGRTWERAAWIKARPVAGDETLFEELQRFTRPFVFRRSRDLRAVEEILDMKRQIDAARPRARLGRAVTDLKLGRGGIREIEFFVQGHQLLFGGRNPRLRGANTLEALRALEASGTLPARDAERLATAYLFLRRVEHRVQLLDDRQTHSLPGGEVGAELARTLGFATLEALEAALREHMDAVHARFRGLLGSVDDDAPVSADVIRLLDPEADDEARRGILERLGSEAPHAALSKLAATRRIPRSPLHPAAPVRAARVGQLLLEECLASPDLDRALSHLPELLRALVLHEAYLQPLEQPALRRGLARLLGASDLLARILVSSPGFIPAVLFGGALPPPETLDPDRFRPRDNDELEQCLVELRLLKQREVLRVAVAELAGAIDYPMVQARLTHLAETIVAAAYRLALEEAYRRYGRPEDPDAALVLLGGGSLGAMELGYRSDVDVSALYVGSGSTTGGERAPVSVTELYTRVVQRLLSFLTLRMPQGELYPVDLRLRPSGSQGALITSLANFERYHREGRAHLWERQALVRTRVIAGDPGPVARATATLLEATYDVPFPKRGWSEIEAMRGRLEASSSKRRNRGVFHLKHGEGGLIEVEFLVQGLMLARGDAACAHANTRRALERAAEAGALSAAEATALAEAHQRHRRTLDWLRVIHDEPLDVIDLGRRSLRPLALALGYQGDDAEARFGAQLERDRITIRNAYRRYVGIEDIS